MHNLSSDYKITSSKMAYCYTCNFQKVLQVAYTIYFINNNMRIPCTNISSYSVLNIVMNSQVYYNNLTEKVEICFLND